MNAVVSSCVTVKCAFVGTGLRTDFEGRCHGAPGEKTGPLAGKNLPEVVNNIVWVRQLLLKVTPSLSQGSCQSRVWKLWKFFEFSG